MNAGRRQNPGASIVHTVPNFDSSLASVSAIFLREECLLHNVNICIYSALKYKNGLPRVPLGALVVLKEPKLSLKPLKLHFLRGSPL